MPSTASRRAIDLPQPAAHGRAVPCERPVLVAAGQQPVQTEVIRAVLVVGERVVPQSEVIRASSLCAATIRAIRAIVLEDSPCLMPAHVPLSASTHSVDGVGSNKTQLDFPSVGFSLRGAIRGDQGKCVG